MSFRNCLLALTTLALLAPVCAADSNKKSNQTVHSTANSSSSDIGWHSWGLRAGMASDVDQFLVGAQCNLGEFTEDLRFQPDLELGAGDDVTSLYATIPVYYRFHTRSSMTPYAGGGPALGYIEVDRPASQGGDESSFEVGARATGGLEWGRRDGQAFFVELSLGFGDVHDVRAVAAWQF